MDNFATRAVLDGWQVSGIVTHLSGAPAPVGLSVTGNPNITGGGDGARIVLTCDPMHNARKTFTRWFNNSGFATPYAGQAYSPQLYTSAGVPVSNSAKAAANYSLPPGGVFSPKVNSFLPRITDLDTALFKDVALNEKGMKLQRRVETYNTFNHPQFNAVNATANFSPPQVQPVLCLDACWGSSAEPLPHAICNLPCGWISEDEFQAMTLSGR